MKIRKISLRLNHHQILKSQRRRKRRMRVTMIRMKSLRKLVRRLIRRQRKKK